MWARVQESCVRLFGWAAVERCAVLCCGVGAGWAEVGLGLGLRLSGEAWYPSPKVLPSLLRRILFMSLSFACLYAISRLLVVECSYTVPAACFDSSILDTHTQFKNIWIQLSEYR